MSVLYLESPESFWTHCRFLKALQMRAARKNCIICWITKMTADADHAKTLQMRIPFCITWGVTACIPLGITRFLLDFPHMHKHASNACRANTPDPFSKLQTAHQQKLLSLSLCPTGAKGKNVCSPAPFAKATVTLSLTLSQKPQ